MPTRCASSSGKCDCMDECKCLQGRESGRVKGGRLAKGERIAMPTRCASSSGRCDCMDECKCLQGRE